MRANEEEFKRLSTSGRVVCRLAALSYASATGLSMNAPTRDSLSRDRQPLLLSLSLFIPRPAAQGRLIPARLQKIDFTNANRHHRQCEAKVNGARCTPEFRCVAVSLHKTEREKNLYRTAKLCPLFTGFRNFL